MGAEGCPNRVLFSSGWRVMPDRLTRLRLLMPILLDQPNRKPCSAVSAPFVFSTRTSRTHVFCPSTAQSAAPWAWELLAEQSPHKHNWLEPKWRREIGHNMLYRRLHNG